MPLDSHFATTVCGAGYSPRYLHSVSHVVRQDPHRLWTRHWGQMTWEFLLSHAVLYSRQVILSVVHPCFPQGLMSGERRDLQETLLFNPPRRKNTKTLKFVFPLLYQLHVKTEKVQTWEKYLQHSLPLSLLTDVWQDIFLLWLSWWMWASQELWFSLVGYRCPFSTISNPLPDFMKDPEKNEVF